MGGLGFPEMVVILIIALVIFGPNRLPTLGESLGKAIRGFKEGLKEKPETIEQNNKEKIEDLIRTIIWRSTGREKWIKNDNGPSRGKIRSISCRTFVEDNHHISPVLCL